MLKIGGIFVGKVFDLEEYYDKFLVYKKFQIEYEEDIVSSLVKFDVIVQSRESSDRIGGGFRDREKEVEFRKGQGKSSQKLVIS